MSIVGLIIITLIMVLISIPAIAFIRWVKITLRQHSDVAAQNQPPCKPFWHHLLLAMAILCLLGSFAAAAYTVYFLRNSQTADSTITSVSKQKPRDMNTDDDNPPDIITYTFTDASGTSYHGKESVIRNQYQVGDPLPVRYVVQYPPTSRIDTPSNHWYLSGFLFVSSFILTLLSWIYSRRYRHALSMNVYQIPGQ